MCKMSNAYKIQAAITKKEMYNMHVEVKTQLNFTADFHFSH